MISGFFKVLGGVTVLVGLFGGPLTVSATAAIGGALFTWGTLIDWYYSPGMPGGPSGDGGGGGGNSGGGGGGNTGCNCRLEIDLGIAGAPASGGGGGVGCAPLALTHRSDDLWRLLLALLAISVLVAAFWWRNRHAKVSRCTRLG